MKNAINIEKAQAVDKSVIVALRKIPNDNKYGVVTDIQKEDFDEFENPSHYMGKILSYGKNVKGVSEGDYCLFHKLAGEHIMVTNPKEMVKVVQEINLVIVSNKSGMKVEDVRVIGDRLLLDVTEKLEEVKNSDGVITSNPKMKSNSLHGELSRGVVLKVSSNAAKEGYKKGDVVYFGADAGLNIKELKGPNTYRTLYWQDVRCILNK